MIEIYYNTTQVREGRQFEMEIKGHADYAERGKDIVCAGVSSLTIALLNELDTIEDEAFYYMDRVIEEGYVHLKCVVPLYQNIVVVETIFDTIYQGLVHISKEKMEYVKLV